MLNKGSSSTNNLQRSVVSNPHNSIYQGPTSHAFMTYADGLAVSHKRRITSAGKWGGVQWMQLHRGVGVLMQKHAVL